MVKIIDCTLRDGGYYNNWKFDIRFIQNYIDTINEAGIEYSEIGYSIFSQSNQTKGICANITNDTLSKLLIPKNLNIGVMVNLENVDINDKNIKNDVFANIDFVRIACTEKNIDKLVFVLSLLKKYNLKIFVNLMQIDLLSNFKLNKIFKFLISLKIDVFYFADSLGSMDPNKVSYFSKKIRNYLKCEIGFHPHNNKSLAFANALESIKSTNEWLDATIFGMGRGAGNLKTEDIVIELNIKNKKFNIKPLYDLIKSKFKKLHEIYSWGPNIYYHYSACSNIHPSYVQNILKDDRYSYDEIFNALNFLKNKKGATFDFANLNLAVNKKISNKILWNPIFDKKFKKLLIIGGGISIKNNLNKIISIIQDTKPLVISVNINQYINQRFIDYFVCCHDSRLIFDHHKYKKIKKPLIIPGSIIDESIETFFNKKNYLNYEVRFEKNSFKLFDNYCILPSQLSFAYAFAIALQAGYKSIDIAGFDGHIEDKLNSNDIDHFLNIVKNNIKDVSIRTLTKSTYNF